MNITKEALIERGFHQNSESYCPVFVIYESTDTISVQVYFKEDEINIWLDVGTDYVKAKNATNMEDIEQLIRLFIS